MTSTTPEANSDHSSLTGATSSRSAEPVTDGSETTLRPRENGAGFATEDCGTFPTEHQSHNTDAQTGSIPSEVPPVHTEGAEGLRSQGAVESAGTEAGHNTATDALRPRKVRMDRKRKAHWTAAIGVKEFRFSFDPQANVITVRKRGTRKASARTITMPELVEALAGQKLLPL